MNYLTHPVIISESQETESEEHMVKFVTGTNKVESSDCLVDGYNGGEKGSPYFQSIWRFLTKNEPQVHFYSNGFLSVKMFVSSNDSTVMI